MIKRLLVGLGIVVLVVTVALVLKQYQGHRDYSRAYENWQAVGGIELEQLRPARIPEAANAAILYIEAFELMQPLLSQSRAGEKPFEEPLCDHSVLQAIVETAYAAGQRPQCVWFSSWFDLGFDAQLYHLGSARDLAWVLAEAARCAGLREDYDDAARAIAAGITLGNNAIASEPSLLSAVVAASIHTVILDVMEAVLDDGGEPIDDALLRAFEATDYQEILRRGLIGDGAVHLDWMQKERLPLYAPIAGYSKKGDMSVYLELMTHAIEQAGLPQWERDWSVFNVELPYLAALTEGTLSPTKRMILRISQIEVRMLMAEQAIRLRQYKAANGEYPEVWPISSGPVVGGALHYERDGDGFVLSSHPGYRGDAGALTWRWR